MNTRNAGRVCLLLLPVLVEIFADDLVVKLNHGGEVRGNTLKTQNGKTIYAFRGIPYAEPPTGELRFKAPISKSPWKGQPLDATKDGPTCIQIQFFSTTTAGQEDCLILNVYTTKLPGQTNNGSKMSVMVFIHGGAFSAGGSTSSEYGPGLLLDEDVILVSINYRVGPIGFLSTGDDASFGNYGLMDQSLALQWVKDNIEVFGGDANLVTIFGESAGGASVEYHLLSPMSAGLFSSAISQSGSPFCPWAMQKHPYYWAKRLGEDLDCPTHSTADMIECLREIPAIDIVKTTYKYKLAPGVLLSIFSPTVGGPFLPMEPKEIVVSGKANKVPFISGVTKDEGLITYLELYLSANMSDIQHLTAEIFRFWLDDQGRAHEAASIVMDKYFSKLNWADKDVTRRTVIKAYSDGQFIIPHYEMNKLLAENGFSVYSYSLDYEPSVGLGNYFGVSDKWGVCHADDIGFLFDGDLWLLKNSTADDKKIRKVFCSSWANFAKYGNPTPNTSQDDPLKWKLSTSSEMQIYHIDNPVTTSAYNPDKDELYLFWTETIPGILNKTIPHK